MRLNVAGSTPVIETQPASSLGRYRIAHQLSRFSGALHGLVAAFVKRLHEGSSPSAPTLPQRTGTITMNRTTLKHGPTAPSINGAYDAIG